MNFPDKIGEEKYAALQHRHDSEGTSGIILRDTGPHAGDTLPYHRLIEENALKPLIQITDSASHVCSRHRSYSSFNQNI